MGIKLQSTGYEEPWILGLREVSKFKIAPIQIAQEVFGLQVVGSIAHYRTAILEQGEFGQVDVLPGKAQGGGQTVIGLARDGPARDGKIGSPVQIAQRSFGMSLEA